MSNKKVWKIKAVGTDIRRTAVTLPPRYWGNTQFNSEGISVPIDEDTARASVETGLFEYHESPGNIHNKEHEDEIKRKEKELESKLASLNEKPSKSNK